MFKRMFKELAAIGICVFTFTNLLASPSRVYTLSNQLIVEKRLNDGTLQYPQAYLIKGVAWQPATRAPLQDTNPLKPSENIQYGFFLNTPWLLNYWLRTEITNHYIQDINLMNQMNVNTVRLYTDFGTLDDPLFNNNYNAILDEFYQKGIMVIMPVANSRDDLDKDRFDVYTDYKAPYNHFVPSGWMGDTTDLQFNDQETQQAFSGSCIKIVYSAQSSQGKGWAGIYFQSYPKNWGDYPGLNLQGFNKLVFKAKGANGGEKIKVKVGGITGDTANVEYGPVTLTNTWQDYSINLAGKDLSNIRGGFGITFSATDGAETVYLDDIYYTYDPALGGERRVTRYEKIVALCKDHPAILMWSLGNEWNLDNINKYLGYPTAKEAAMAVNTAAQGIKQMDSNHPVTSCLGDRFDDPLPENTISGIVSACPNIDIWGINVYRSISFGDLFSRWQLMATTKPFYLSEFGTDSFNTTTYSLVNGYQADNCVGNIDQDMQKNLELTLWDEIKNNASAINYTKMCLGGTVFEFNDELWKVGNYNVGLGALVNYNNDTSYNAYNTEGFVLVNGHPDNVANEEYFGVVDADRNQKSAFWGLQNYYLSLDSLIPQDPIPPAPINNLSITQITGSSVTLSWTAPGDDWDRGTAASYDIRYSTANITDKTSWDAATKVTSGVPIPLIAGSTQNIIITGLSPVTKYYFAIKTSDEVANISGLSNVPSATTLDITPPTTPVVTDEGKFTTNQNQLYASWTAVDNESGIVEYQYKITQDTKTGSIIKNWTSTGIASSVSVSGLTLLQGKTYYFSVKAKNGAGLWSGIGYSDGIKVDTTIPSIPIVSDGGDYTYSATSLKASWTSSDLESGIVESRYIITRDSPTGEIVKDWTSTGTSKSVSVTGLTLLHGKTYYFGVMTKNGAGLWSPIGYSNGIIIDITAATKPIVTDEGATTTNTVSLSASWFSSDPESGIVNYQYKITQDTTTGIVILNWTSTGTASSVNATGLTLTIGKKYYFGVKALNGAGKWSTVGYSDGITVVAP